MASIDRLIKRAQVLLDAYEAREGDPVITEVDDINDIDESINGLVFVLNHNKFVRDNV